MTGVYGKLPAHGDFVRRELPLSFIQPWDEWLQAGLGAARDALGSEFDATCATAPPWRFRLPAGACGSCAVVGVLLPSRDSVGRTFPLTLAALIRDDEPMPNAHWYAELEQAGIAGRDQDSNVEALLATLPSVNARAPSLADDIPAVGWWRRDGSHWSLASLPSIAQFHTLLQGDAQVADQRADQGVGRRGRPTGRAASHRGTVRSRNEDAYVDRSDIGLWAVADGAGGHGAGHEASAAAAAALADLPMGLSAAEMLAQVRLRLGGVHVELQRRATESSGGDLLATTVVVLIARNEHFACLWAGDSRAYLLRGDTMRQITRDHSLVQELVDAGALAPEDAEGHPRANVITRAIGSREALLLDKISGRLMPGDLLLLCSDGLFKALPEKEIGKLLNAGQGPEQLIEEALRNGARDNVTALVVEV